MIPLQRRMTTLNFSSILTLNDFFEDSNYRPMSDIITSNGTTAYIDTGVPGNDETLVFQLRCAIRRRQSYAGIFGNYQNENTRCWRLFQNNGTNDTPYYRYNVYNRRGGASNAINVTLDGSTITGQPVDFKLAAKKIVAKMEGWPRNSATAVDDNTLEISNNNIVIGAAGPNSIQSGTQSIIFYYFRIWSHGWLIRNYLPCQRISDETIGFFDTVNKTFHPSIGSTEFISSSGIK